MNTIDKISTALITIATMAFGSYILSWAWNTLFQKIPEIHLDFWQVVAIIVIVFSVKIIENLLYSMDIRNAGKLNGESRKV